MVVRGGLLEERLSDKNSLAQIRIMSIISRRNDECVRIVRRPVWTEVAFSLSF